MYRLEVIEDGATLYLQVTWPSELTKVRKLYSLWLVFQKRKSVSEYHPKLGGFENALVAVRHGFLHKELTIAKK